MFGLLIDSGLDGLRGTVEYCDDCDTSTLHLAAPEGVAVCGLCGYNPIFDSITDEAGDDSYGGYDGLYYLDDYR